VELSDLRSRARRKKGRGSFSLRVGDWLEDEEIATEDEEDVAKEARDFEEAKREYPPAPAAITIITIATITAALLLIARLF